MVCLSVCFYTVFWVVYMSYVAVSYFVLHQRSAVQCVTTSECIIGGAPPDIVYGVPYIIPTVIVMVSLGVTMWYLQVKCAINPPQHLQVNCAINPQYLQVNCAINPQYLQVNCAINPPAPPGKLCYQPLAPPGKLCYQPPSTSR